MFIGCSLENYTQRNDRYELLHYEKFLSIKYIKYPFGLRTNLTNKNCYITIIQEQFMCIPAEEFAKLLALQFL